MNFPERPDASDEIYVIPAEYATGPRWVGLFFIASFLGLAIGAVALVGALT